MTKKNNKIKQTIKYVFADWLCALIVWILFFFFRKHNEDPVFFEHYQVVFKDFNFIKGIIGVPLFWLMLYTISGYYNNVFSKSRLKELGQTFIVVLLGVVILFFITIIDDVIDSYKSYYVSFSMLFGLSFFIQMDNQADKGVDFRLRFLWRMALLTINLKRLGFQ